MSGPFLPFRTPADGPAGLLLTVNPASVSHISSVFDKKYGQSMQRIHLVNGRTIGVFEPDVDSTLEALGLGEFTQDWVLDLTKDLV